ncbi:cyclodeaminase/cyclohydrolase family protein [Acidaminobacter sp. JC074]|uniref:cyclodeaminase/cyclohydrolase family protein n=1 Tax=Acidaminobacter sp. JC074 TaxID=2530199 RepID=UPI001F0F03A7|nr:cyclodeaminase/cyclohydrolase family protein [Acidaminobacter sp. JC074]MCH4888689.1 cyclodeaminase/cyclohydrolase family protein [Acidaminobacter sp. JC074]
MLINKNITDFVATTASNEPVPGGGSIAALSGALAAALAEMVANLTIGKKKYVEVESEMKGIVEALEVKRQELIELIDKDANSFDDVMKAFKLPKETDEEKAARTNAIQEGTKYAASVPLQTAKVAFSIMEYSKIVVEKGNTNAVTDGAVSAMMARTAVLSALMNVKINLGSIKDEKFVEDMTAEVNELEAAAIKTEGEILSLVKL